MIPDPELRTILHGSSKQGSSKDPKNTASGVGRLPAQARNGVLARMAGTKASTTKSLNILLVSIGAISTLSAVV